MELSKRTNGWLKKLESTALHGDAVKLLNGDPVEVGYRATCGCTDQTMRDFEVFRKFIKALKAQSLDINETPVVHKNAYATNNGGFWNSHIFEVLK
jgi:hypothetical protein